MVLVALGAFLAGILATLAAGFFIRRRARTYIIKGQHITVIPGMPGSVEKALRQAAAAGETEATYKLVNLMNDREGIVGVMMRAFGLRERPSDEAVDAFWEGLKEFLFEQTNTRREN